MNLDQYILWVPINDGGTILWKWSVKNYSVEVVCEELFCAKGGKWSVKNYSVPKVGRVLVLCQRWQGYDITICYLVDGNISRC